jgi:acyl dehydratase
MTTVAAGTSLPDWDLASVSEQAMHTMALLLRDPNPIHYDTAVTQATGLGPRTVNQGPSNVGYVANMLIAWAGDPAAIRRLKVRFEANVFAGDHVTASGEVTSVERTPDGALAHCDVRLTRDDGTRLLSGTAEVLVRA